MHIARDYALAAEGLVELRVEKLEALLVLGALAEGERLLARRDAHVALENARLVEVSIVVQAEVCFVVDAV